MPEKTDTLKRQVSDKHYASFADVAFKTAFSITGKREDAEDIAQIVTMRYLLNEHKITSSSPQNWAVTTSRNESYLILKKNKELVPKNNDDFQSYEQEITESLLDRELNDGEAEKLLAKIRRYLPEVEQTILIKYFFEGKKLSELISKYRKNINKKSLYQKVYRLRRDARAEYARSRCMKSSKDIINFNLNQRIIRFIRKYKECMDNRSFEPIKNYFRADALPAALPKFCIEEIIDYDVVLIGRNKYKIFTSFVTKRGAIDIFSAVISTDKNSVFIENIPDNSDIEYCVVLDEDSLPAGINEKLSAINKKGFTDISHKDLERLLNNRLCRKVIEITGKRKTKLKKQ